MEIVKDNPKSEELITKTKVKNTPFEVITNNETGKSFGAFGMYKITEEFDNMTACKDDLKKITWDKIIMVISLINEMLNNQNKK